MRRLTKIRLPKVFMVVLLIGWAPLEAEETNTSQTEKYRIVWFEDPTTTATFVWNQLKGNPATLHYGTKDHDRKFTEYPGKQKADKVVDFDGMKNCMVTLRNLSPDTSYFICLSDEYGVSRRFYFHTAPNTPKPFSFIAGGDSRNHRNVRQAANTMVQKLQPLFVAFTGDMINQDNATEWNDWLNDWQLTTNDNGRLIPIAPHRGNHEARAVSVPNHFGMPKDSYAAFNIGGKLLRYYILNSQIPADGAQGAWLKDDLKNNADGVTHLVAGYHKPMRPHTSGKALGRNPYTWADTFYDYGFDLVLESDSHVMKRTLPVKPDATGKGGFTAAPDDPKATIYVGEGCWGAPLRAANVNYPWTVDRAAFNGFDWVQVTPDALYDKTVKVDNVSSVGEIDPKDPYKNPTNLELWNPNGGDEVLQIPAD